MARPQIVSPTEFRRDVADIVKEQSILYQHIKNPSTTRKAIFNFAFEDTTVRFGYLPVLKGEHDSILSPAKDEKPYKGFVFPAPYDHMFPIVLLSHQDKSVFSGPNEEQKLFRGFVIMARFMIESCFPMATELHTSMIYDLKLLNETAENPLFQGPMQTLEDLARKALPEDTIL